MDLGEVASLSSYSLLLSNPEFFLKGASSDEKIQQILQNRDLVQKTPLLYNQFFKPLEKELQGVKTLFIAPDGLLAQIPFARLKKNEDRYWIEDMDLRRLQTGRDLLSPSFQSKTQGLLALGGIDYDRGQRNLKSSSTKPSFSKKPRINRSSLNEEETKLLAKKTRSLFRKLEGNFEFLHATQDEVARIASYYRNTYIGEKAEVWRREQASEGRLKSFLRQRPIAPRVLHLATHGFYLGNEDKMGEVGKNRPLTLSGLALAGANQGIQGKLGEDQEDGVLCSLEVLGLNLKGTETSRPHW